MNDERQSRLLADFVAALRQDAHAMPPAELDPGLAAMARQLTLARTLSPDAAVRERVWRRALAASQTTRASANGRAPRTSDKESYPMTAIPRALPQSRNTHPFTLIAAVLALVIMASVLLFNRPPSGPADDQPGMLSQPEQQDEATATPLPTLAVTPTPVPAALATMTATPFPVASPTLVPSPTLALIEHRVERGETLLTILQLYGVTDPAAINQIMMMNPPAREGTLAEGDIILIPMSVPTLVPAAPGTVTATPFLPTLVPSDVDQSLISPLVPTLVPSNAATDPTLTMVPAMGQPTLSSRGSIFEVLPVTALPPTVEPPGWMLPEPQPIAFGDTVEGVIDQPRPFAYYSFSGEQGDLVTIRVTGKDGHNTRLTLTMVTPGLALAFDDDGGPGYDPEIYRYALTDTTEFGILVESVGAGGGRFTLTLEHEATPSEQRGSNHEKRTVKVNSSQ